MDKNIKNNDEIAIQVSKVSKNFKLPHESNNSIKGKLINFRKRGYENQRVLKNISFQVKKGEFFGIIGKNGSGKSTLLKIISGIYTPTDGNIIVNGKLTPFIELGVGFNPELSGRDNVFLNGALLGFSRKHMETIYDDIVEFAELERFMDQKLKNYSSGMQVRLAFSIAIRAESDILILDEVLAVGDQAFQNKCFDYFSKLKKNHKTLVLVTHDMGSAKRFCDRGILIDKGNIILEGSMEKVANRYTLENYSKEVRKNSKKSGKTPWIKIELLSPFVIEKGKKLKCKIVYWIPDDIKVGVGVSIIDSNSSNRIAVIEDSIVDKNNKVKITSSKKGKYSFEYSVSLDIFNDRDLEIIAALFKFNENGDPEPLVFIKDRDIIKFTVRNNKGGSLLNIKGLWG